MRNVMSRKDIALTDTAEPRRDPGHRTMATLRASAAQWDVTSWRRLPALNGGGSSRVRGGQPGWGVRLWLRVPWDP